MRSLAQCIPDLKALLQRQNDQIDKLSSDVATANGKAADLQRQLDAANAQISAQVSDPALKSLNDILDANPTPAVSSSPEMTTFDQGK